MVKGATALIKDTQRTAPPQPAQNLEGQLLELIEISESDYSLLAAERARRVKGYLIEMAKVEPVFEMLPGWHTPTFGIDNLDALPERARAYLRFLEERTGVEVGSVSTGPERNQTLVVPGSKLAKLLG